MEVSFWFKWEFVLIYSQWPLEELGNLCDVNMFGGSR